MLLPQQLYQYLPRKVINWSPQDVQLWFQVHSITVAPEFNFVTKRLNGSKFLEITPQYLYNECGIQSNIVIKTILEWLQLDREQFQQYVESEINENCSQITEKPSNQGVEIAWRDKENIQENQLSQLVDPKHLQAIIPLINVQKWKSKQKSLSHQQSKSKISQSQGPHSTKDLGNIKYTQSSYEICENYLSFTFRLNNDRHSAERTILLKDSGKIGRDERKEVMIAQDSVSRNHAQITRIGNEYYLQDVGSKYGTFIEIGADYDRPLQQEDFIAFDDYYIQILSKKVFKQKEKECFDLKIRLHKAKDSFVTSFYAQRQISIGHKDRDISFTYPQIKQNHAKMVVINGNIFLRKQEGDCYLKLKRQELYHLQETQEMRFGVQNVTVRICRQTKPVENAHEYLHFDE